MKKVVLAILIVTVSSICDAQRIKVHQGNHINSFMLSDVDSITHDGNESVTVYYNSQQSNFSVNNVDSLSINSERLECYNISSDQLNGWDGGVFCITNDVEDFYIVSKTNYDDNGEGSVVVCINSFANDMLEKAINFIFDIDGNLQEIITAGYQFKAQKFEDEYIFVVYKDGVCYGSFNVPYEVVHINESISENSSRRRSPFFNCKGEISLPKIKDFLEKAEWKINVAGSTIDFISNLEKGTYGEILMDILVGRVVGTLKLPYYLVIIANDVIKKWLKDFYEQDIRRLIGDAKIEITSIRRTSETTITVEGTIANISSIPQTIIVASEYYNPKYDGYIKDIPNTVYWGVAEGSGQPGMYLNDNSSGIMEVLNENFSYTFDIDRIPGQILYFRPFLVPEVSMNSIYTCIRYGERKDFIDIDVELSNFKQTKCYKENNQYKAQFTIDGSIPELFQDLSGWGIEVKTKSGLYKQLYFANENDIDYYPPIEKSFTCDITIEDGDITDYGIERIAEIKITPFVSYRNSLPPLIYLDEKNYTITVKDNPPLQFKELMWGNVFYANDNVYGTVLAVVEVPPGQDVDLSAYESCGVWMTNNITGMEYYADIQENGSMQFLIPLEIPRDEFEKDYDSFTATCDKILFSTYAVDEDGNIIRNDERVADIIYDVPLGITFKEASITGTQVIKRDEDNRPEMYRTDYSFVMDVTGVFWISAIQFRDYSTISNYWNGYSNWATVSADASYTLKSYIEYDADVNMSHTHYFRMQLTDGSIINSTNSLVFGGVPSNPTIHIGGEPSQAPAINVVREDAKEVFTSPFEIVKENAIIRNRITNKAIEGR